jgi:hypothetical protein
VTKVASVFSGFWVELLLDDATLARLDEDDFYLYQILMAQPDNKALVFNFNDDMFGYDEFVQVFVTNVIELIKGAWLNILIVQISACKHIFNSNFFDVKV